MLQVVSPPPPPCPSETTGSNPADWPRRRLVEGREGVRSFFGRPCRRKAAGGSAWGIWQGWRPRCRGRAGSTGPESAVVLRNSERSDGARKESWGGCERGSAATLSSPGRLPMPRLNSEIKVRCRCWRANQGEESLSTASERLMVGENKELPALQHEAEVSNGSVNHHQTTCWMHCSGTLPMWVSRKRRRAGPMTSRKNVSGQLWHEWCKHRPCHWW